jgi:hypothetical protein
MVQSQTTDATLQELDEPNIDSRRSGHVLQCGFQRNETIVRAIFTWTSGSWGRGTEYVRAAAKRFANLQALADVPKS